MAIDTMDLLGKQEGLRKLLEDFTTIGGIGNMVIVPSTQVNDTFHQYVAAASFASAQGLRDINGARERYYPDPVFVENSDLVQAYTECYFAGKSLVNSVLSNFGPKPEDEPTLGVYGASIALLRVEASFFSAHMLFRLGYSFEGYAVCRVILEQLSWAYSASQLEDLSQIEKLKPNKNFTNFKNLIPDAGKIYSFLSDMAHISYKNHGRFLERNSENGLTIKLTSLEYRDFSVLLLELADMFSIVWEYTQFNYLCDHVATTTLQTGIVRLDPDRQFVEEKLRLLKRFDEIEHGKI